MKDLISVEVFVHANFNALVPFVLYLCRLTQRYLITRAYFNEKWN